MKFKRKYFLAVFIPLILLAIFQSTYAENFSFHINPIDNYLHFGTVTTYLITTVLVCIYFVIVQKNRIIRVVSGVFGVFLFLFLFVISIVTAGIVFSGDKSNMRYHFYERDGVQYYLRGERFWAFSGGPELKYYKEKEVLKFIYYRDTLSVEESEMFSKERQKAVEQYLEEQFK